MHWSKEKDKQWPLKYSTENLILIKSGTRRVSFPTLKRVWRHQRGNQNPYIEEEQTMAK